MKIRFETTIEDIVAFNRFHCENSPMWQRQRMVASLLVPATLSVLILIAIAVSLEKLTDMRVLGIIVAGMVIVLIFFSVAWYFYIRWRMMANVLSAVRKLLAEGTNRSITGWREMDLINNRLIVKMELIDISYDLRAIEKIVSDEDHTFVYVSSIQAFMIPMTLYPEEEYRQFVAELLDAWDNRDVPQPEAKPADERIVEGRV